MPDPNIGENLKEITSIIAIMSGKGGVGKTTVAVNLACALASEGKSIGILDADFTGPNVPKMLGIEDSKLAAEGNAIVPAISRNGMRIVSTAFILDSRDSPVIWRGPMKMQVINQFLGQVAWGKLDDLIIDLPPGTGDESLSIAQQIPRASAIIVTTPQEVALLDSRKSVNFARQLTMNVLGIIENMSGMTCPHCGKDIDLFKVPGAFEIPLVAKKVAKSGRYDAVICLGAVIRGATPHFDYVANEVSKGIAHVSLETDIPIAFGVLTTDTLEQAIERAGSKAGNKGWDAAMAAIEMTNLIRGINP